MKIVYLSGTLTGRPKKEVAAERKKATDLLEAAGFLVFDPVSLEKTTPGTNFKVNHSKKDMATFIRKEKRAIENCHAVLLLTGDVPSDGSWCEALYMLYQLKGPVVMVSPLRAAGKLTSWSNVEMTKVVATVEEAIPALTEVCTPTPLELVKAREEVFLEPEPLFREEYCVILLGILFAVLAVVLS